MSKEEKIVNYPSSIDTRVALLEQSISHINQVLIDIKSEFRDMRNHFDRLMSGIYLMFGASLIAVIFKVFHG